MAKRNSPINGRNIILLLLLIGFTLLVLTRFASLSQLITGLLKGSLMWVLFAVVVHLIFFLMYGVLYYLSFRVVDIKLNALKLFPVLLAGLFINAVAPTGGAGGAALFVAYGRSKGKSGSLIAVGVLVTLIADLLTLIPFLIYGVWFLWSQHAAKYYEVLGMAFYLIFILGMSAILLVARYKANWVKWLLTRVQRIANWAGHIIHKPDLISDEWVESNSKEFVRGSTMIARHPLQVALVLGWAVLAHLVNLVGLYLFFIAYNQSVSLGTLIAAFSLGIVFFIVTIIPQGVGAVEGIMGLVMISMGVPNAKAAVIALAYRGINFWIPVLAGFITYNILFSGFQIAGIHNQTEDSSPGDEKEQLHEDTDREPDV